MSKPVTVDVKVIYKPGQTPNVELDSSITKNGLLEFKNDGNDGFWVNFVLDDVTLKEYRFVNSGMSPMYSAVATDDKIPCPTSGLWEKFKPHSVEKRSLLVRNKNGALPTGKKEERFGFTLRVTKDPDGNGPVIDLDPGGVNGNGPITRKSDAVTFAAGAATGVLLTLGAQALHLI